jgi:hypothetical protein
MAPSRIVCFRNRGVLPGLWPGLGLVRIGGLVGCLALALPSVLLKSPRFGRVPMGTGYLPGFGTQPAQVRDCV